MTHAQREYEHQQEVDRINREIYLEHSLHPVSREERIEAANKILKDLEEHLRVLNEDTEDIDGLYDDLFEEPGIQHYYEDRPENIVGLL